MKKRWRRDIEETMKTWRRDIEEIMKDVQTRRMRELEMALIDNGGIEGG